MLICTAGPGKGFRISPAFSSCWMSLITHQNSAALNPSQFWWSFVQQEYKRRFEESDVKRWPKPTPLNAAVALAGEHSAPGTHRFPLFGCMLIVIKAPNNLMANSGIAEREAVCSPIKNGSNLPAPSFIPTVERAGSLGGNKKSHQKHNLSSFALRLSVYEQ